MLLNSALIEATALALAPLTIPRLIDPVMVSRAGSVLLEPEAIEAYRQRLLPLAAVITPNIHEARLLSGEAVEGAADVERVAERLLALGPQAVLIKGGGLPELRGRDYLLQRTDCGQWLAHTPVDTPHSHGSGCTLGAAITAELAKGQALLEAVRAAKNFVENGLRKGLAIGAGQGPLCHWHPLL
jgi:hydroxymethylpyrimidine/phosphomethylpyrimidine kinase